MLDGFAFALCLTHDVDRPEKRLHQALYYAAVDRSLGGLASALSPDDPYWQFEEIMALERDLGVRSAFYFLNEPHLLFECPPREWLRPDNWVQHLGRYDVSADAIADVIRRLDDGGWEVGVHGSYHSFDDRARLCHEVETLEGILGHPILGGRQHYLRLAVPETWEHHAAAGLAYDSSLGSSTDYGFDRGYRPFAPFDDEFVVFPLTLMESALPDPAAGFERPWAACQSLLDEAAENDAVMTVLWHPRLFDEAEFPGYGRLYRRLVERALEMGAWVGPPGRLYERLQGTDWSRWTAPDVA